MSIAAVETIKGIVSEQNTQPIVTVETIIHPLMSQRIENGWTKDGVQPFFYNITAILSRFVEQGLFNMDVADLYRRFVADPAIFGMLESREKNALEELYIVMKELSDPVFVDRCGKMVVRESLDGIELRIDELVEIINYMIIKSRIEIESDCTETPYTEFLRSVDLKKVVLTDGNVRALLTHIAAMPKERRRFLIEVICERDPKYYIRGFFIEAEHIHLDLTQRRPLD